MSYRDVVKGFVFPVLMAVAITSSAAQEPVKPTAMLTAGDLRVTVAEGEGGIRVTGLVDLATQAEMLASPPLPLFTLTLRQGPTGEEVRLGADAGWRQVEIAGQGSNQLELKWIAAEDQRLAGIRVVAQLAADSAAHAVRWHLEVDNENRDWGVWRMVFPQLAIADLGEQACTFLPRGPGEEQPGLWQRPFQFRDTYPGAWMTMQFMAAYDRARQTGLYVGLHDPTGSTKDLAVESRPAEHSVLLQFDVPAPSMGQPGTGFPMEGEAVWQLIRGDWFDAAVIYRDWVRQHAGWYPLLSPEGRDDTTPEMRTLAAWALGGADPWPTGGPPSAEKLDETKKFGALFGTPVGMHWYGWHQRPFDNDYPHYFPAKDGFKEAVADLQASGVLVMPYINGRLWDTRDRDVADAEFSQLAKPYAVKDEQGNVVTEEYGSKESDGSPVKFAVMCPATTFWQDRVYDITMELYRTYGVKGVYIDQIAASAARLCFDPSHGHPLGGGHWWADGYRQMLDRIRRDMPAGSFLTTECNAEAYVRWFDGYLTWHWQHDGQVPAFPVVYGGSLQMFGRSYGGGETRDLALRMKAGQQLTFGEQIGWISPSVLAEQENAEFLKAVIGLRRRLQQYFAMGEMARPPKVDGAIPSVKADWGWGGGNWWVTTNSLLTSTWLLPRENRLAVILVNVSDQPITATVALDAKEYGIEAKHLRGQVLTWHGASESFPSDAAVCREVVLQPHEAQAWEFKPDP